MRMEAVVAFLFYGYTMMPALPQEGRPDFWIKVIGGLRFWSPKSLCSISFSGQPAMFIAPPAACGIAKAQLPELDAKRILTSSKVAARLMRPRRRCAVWEYTMRNHQAQKRIAFEIGDADLRCARIPMLTRCF